MTDREREQLEWALQQIAPAVATTAPPPSANPPAGPWWERLEPLPTWRDVGRLAYRHAFGLDPPPSGNPPAAPAPPPGRDGEPAEPAAAGSDGTPPGDGPAIASKPPEGEAEKVARGTLDERAVALLLTNPTLTVNQLAKAVRCRPGTLYDKTKCPKLTGARRRSKPSAKRTGEDRPGRIAAGTPTKRRGDFRESSGRRRKNLLPRNKARNANSRGDFGEVRP